jgi:serine/threonine protein phosphatase 1
MNTYVIGDIHGGLRGLKELIEQAKPTKEDTLIFLGDYVDGWSESAQVIDYLMELEKLHNTIFILGNHDVYCLEWLKTGNAKPTWLNHGGVATMKSYLNIEEERKLELINFYERLKNFYVDSNNNLFIHAGFTSMHGPEQEFHPSMYNWDRTLWEMAVTMDKLIKKDSKLFPKRLLLYNEIYIGHTPTLNYDIEVPMQGCNVWNIDTGAGFHGKLTMLNIHTKAFYQSEFLQKLYPDEKGRNK